MSTAFQMLLGGAAMIVVGLAAGEAGEVDLASSPPARCWRFAYLITFGSLLAYTAYTWLLRNAPISTVATYAYVNPVIAVVLGALILSEEVDRGGGGRGGGHRALGGHRRAARGARG